MKEIKLKRHGIKKKDGILIESHTPVTLLGKYSDYIEGSVVSFNAKELYFKSICGHYKEDYVKLYLNKTHIIFSLKELNYNLDDKGTLKGLIYGLFKELIDRKILVNFNGLIFSSITNIKSNEGYEINFLINLFKSIINLYELNVSDSLICEMIKKIYKEYYGKIVPLLYLLSFFQDGVSYLRLFKNNLTIEKCLDNLDRFTFVDVRIGNPCNVNESNTYLSSLYDVYQNVKNYTHVENLSDINYQYFFNYLFGPYSTLKDYEKLVITHYFEEEKRAKNVLEAFKDKQISTKLFDAVNMSNTEIGSYLNLNKRNNFIEANIYKGTFLKQIALTEMNIEANNNFIYIINHEDEETLKYKFMKIKNYPYGIISISPIGVLVEKYRK